MNGKELYDYMKDLLTTYKHMYMDEYGNLQWSEDIWNTKVKTPSQKDIEKDLDDILNL